VPFCISTGFSHRIPEAGKHFGKVSFVLESVLKQKHLPEKERKLKRPTRDWLCGSGSGCPRKKESWRHEKKGREEESKEESGLKSHKDSQQSSSSALNQ